MKSKKRIYEMELDPTDEQRELLTKLMEEEINLQKGRCGSCREILPSYKFSKKTEGHKVRFCKKCNSNID